MRMAVPNCRTWKICRLLILENLETENLKIGSQFFDLSCFRRFWIVFYCCSAKANNL